MHLVSCVRPEGPLEPAPASSLREAAAGEQWEGFWCVADERFYTRCTTPTDERWYRIADLGSTTRPRAAVRVLPFPALVSRSPRMIVGRYRGQAMLVGTQARRGAPKGER